MTSTRWTWATCRETAYVTKSSGQPSIGIAAASPALKTRVMENSSNPSESGARFFDHSGRDLGWASKVSQRSPLVGNLTVLDVTTTDVGLAASLVNLDRDRLSVKSGDALGESFTFLWASGYANGPQIRIQGMLADNHR